MAQIIYSLGPQRKLVLISRAPKCTLTDCVRAGKTHTLGGLTLTPRQSFLVQPASTGLASLRRGAAVGGGGNPYPSTADWKGSSNTEESPIANLNNLLENSRFNGAR